MKRSIAISILLAAAILNLGCNSEKSSEEKVTWGRADAKELNLPRLKVAGFLLLRSGFIKTTIPSLHRLNFP
ncbi:MAG: hypothetical protein IJ575_03245 [Selenomonadaceae bacterium]|nr:hypothetical protein [Selenomonadaceae bacterium]